MADDKPPFPKGNPMVPAGEAQPSGTNHDAVTPGNPAPAPILKPIPLGTVSSEPLAVPPIPLNPPPLVRRTQATISVPNKKETEPKDTFRELIETVVFVVVLVLMLKTFLAEAFVIPTGSMATTLLGYHHKVTCQQCGYPNLVNASSEADPQDAFEQYVISCQCQNCGFTNVLRRLAPRGVQP